MNRAAVAIGSNIDLDIVVWNDQIVDDDVYTRAYLADGIRQVLPQLVFSEPRPEGSD
jgi:hypothetical protein